MKISFWRVGLVAALLLVACGGDPAVCVKADTVDLSTKAGDCLGLDLGKPLGSKAACIPKVAPCSASEQATLTSMLTCLGNLQTCTTATQSTFISLQAACYSTVSSLSPACSKSVFGDVLPGQDGGVDGGQIDAGRQPINDGGAVVDFVAVADETGFAFAWSSQQDSSAVAKWELNVFGPDGGRLPEIYFTPGSARAAELPDSGSMLTRRYFLAGVNNANALLFGVAPDAGTVIVDAGSNCMLPTDCAPDRVCDLGTCKPQSCQPAGANTCPPGYTCYPDALCHRQFSDAGTLDAGMTVNTTFTPMPLLSTDWTVTTQPPGISAGIPVGGFTAMRPAVAAIDSARQFIAVEQENQPFGHFTVRRGAELINDTGSTSPIDTLGGQVRLTYVPESDTVFACYSVGRGVRVRRSRDLGKTWGTSAVTLEPVDDGGFSSRFYDCDIAAWKNGSAIMSYIEDDAIAVRTVTETLSVSPPDYAFFSSPTDGGGGNVYGPSHTTIATLPSASIVHVGFTAIRAVSSGADTEVYDLYRDGNTGTFLPATLINRTATGGNGFPQDYVSIAVAPLPDGGTSAVAAYGSLENTGGSTYSTVYVSLFSPTTHQWITGSDLTVFAKQLTAFPVFPARNIADTWDAFSPSLAVTKNGKIYLSVVAGPRNGGGVDFRMYLVGFDFNAQSPIGGKGWFLPPAVKMSESRVLDPRGGGNIVAPNVSALTSDTQLSVYGVFIEGIGQFGEMQNRAVYLSRP